VENAAQPQDEDAERRLLTRIRVNERATLLLGHVASASPCVLAELCLDGCRLRSEGEVRVDRGARVEVLFRLRGKRFRLSGVLEQTARTAEIEVAFTGMSPECEAELAGELDALWAEGAAGSGEAGDQAAAGGGEGERRRQRRHEVDSRASVFLVDVGSNLLGRIVDVSMSGCRIRFLDRFPVGIYRRVEVEFTLDGLGFRLAGVIQSMDDAFTAGIRFVSLSERKLEQLGVVIAEIAEMGAQGPAVAEKVEPC